MSENVSLHIIEAGDGVVWASASGFWGTVELVGSLRLEGRIVYLDGADVGRLGRVGLNAIARKMLEDADADEIVVQGSVRTSGRNPGRAPRTFRFPNPKRPV